jgi:competence ComEA-like helix-hairpin-helix protein
MAWRSPAIRAFVSCFFFAFLLFTVASTATTKKPPLRPVNINTATSEELQQVPGIGPVTAEKILQMRKSYGAFKSVDDLLAIKGIGKKRLDKMRKYLTVGKPAAVSKTPPPKTQSKEPTTPTEQPPPSN